MGIVGRFHGPCFFSTSCVFYLRTSRQSLCTYPCGQSTCVVFAAPVPRQIPMSTTTYIPIFAHYTRHINSQKYLLEVTRKHNRSPHKRTDKRHVTSATSSRVSIAQVRGLGTGLLHFYNNGKYRIQAYHLRTNASRTWCARQAIRLVGQQRQTWSVASR